MLTVTNIAKAYGNFQVLNQISFTLAPRQRMGLVGANGVGKSTLVKIITGEIEADAGTVQRPAGAEMGYLPQTLATFADQTIADLVDAALASLYALERHMRHLEDLMSQPEPAEYVLIEYGEIAEQFEQRGGYEIDHKIEMVLHGLGIGHLPRTRSVATLSGGERARVGLALLLLQAPDVLLLDEPTNHLDFASLGWLEDYLQHYPGAMLIISHDRQFLNRTVTHILEIDEHTHRAKHYSGDYDAYLRAKSQERRRWEEDYARQQEEIKDLREELRSTVREVGFNRPARDNDKFLKHFKRGRVESTVSRRIASAEERLRRIEENPIPQPPEDLRFTPDFDPAKLAGHAPLWVSRLRKYYGERIILQDIAFALDSHSRIALVGVNGAGKSTLLRLLAGLEAPNHGEIYVNPQVRRGYMDQDQQHLDPHQTIFEAYTAGLPGTEQQHKAVILSAGLFRYEELQRPVGSLSSGQKRKLQIARLMAEKANLLILDEPTNYISFDVLEAFEAALQHFPGAVIAATHDRRFLQQFGGEIWALHNGHLIKYSGYAAYLAADIEMTISA